MVGEPGGADRARGGGAGGPGARVRQRQRPRRGVVSLQENNHFVIVSLASRRVVRSFSAGRVAVSGVDTEDDGRIMPDGTITAKREPDGVAWLSDDLFASANEGDSRGWTIVSRDDRVVWDAGDTLERIAIARALPGLAVGRQGHRAGERDLRPDRRRAHRLRRRRARQLHRRPPRQQPPVAALPAAAADRRRPGGRRRGAVARPGRGVQRDRGPGEQPAGRGAGVRDGPRPVPVDRRPAGDRRGARCPGCPRCPAARTCRRR